jgi:hypothetical protein
MEEILQLIKMRTDHIAIDPGVSGGITYFDQDSKLPCAVSMPETPVDIINLLRQLKVNGASRCVIEKLPRFVPMGKMKKGIPGSHVSVMFENYGIIQGAALAIGYRLEKVDPKAWQAGLSLGASKDHKSWKRHLRGRAQELFPHLAPTLKTADSLLIWEFSSREA